MKLIVTGLFAACGLIAAGIFYVYAGIFNVAADAPLSRTRSWKRFVPVRLRHEPKTFNPLHLTMQH